MSKKNRHVIPEDEQWAVIGAGNKKIYSTHRTQEEAIEAARKIAINQRNELPIHGKNWENRTTNQLTERAR